MTLEEFKKPFNLVTLALAIAFGLSTVFFGLLSVHYYHASQERHIAYLWSDVSKIYDSKTATPKMKVLDEVGNPITNDVYLVTLSIWNSGHLPIEPSDVRTPLVVSIHGCNRLLEAKVLAQIAPEISDFRIVETPCGIQNEQRFEIGWKHFDPNRGAKIQILYAANAPAKTGLNLTLGAAGSLVESVPLSHRHEYLFFVAVALVSYCCAYAEERIARTVKNDAKRALIKLLYLTILAVSVYGVSRFFNSRNSTLFDVKQGAVGSDTNLSP
jgi:hypothetical protein